MLNVLNLRNFKAFHDLSVPFSQLTLLTGLNGSGKSSVLQALALLRQSYDAGFLAHGDLILNGEMVELGTALDVLNHNFEGEAQISLGVAFPAYRQGELLCWNAYADQDTDVLKSFSCPDQLMSPPMSLFSPGFQFLRADRITPSVTFPKSHHAIQHNRFLGSHGEFTAHYLLEYGSDDVSEGLMHPSEETAKSLLAQVNAWLQEFSPGVRVEAAPVPMTDFVRLVFSYKGSGQAYGNPIRPTNVGFGLTHALPVVTACLGSFPGAILIIENPEAQLHPQGQVAIGRLLGLTAAAGTQVIVETHSEHVLNGIRLTVKEGLLDPAITALHFFRRNPGAQSDFQTPTLSREGRLSYWPSGFFDEWEKSLDKLLG